MTIARAAPPHSAGLCGTNGTSRTRTVCAAPSSMEVPPASAGRWQPVAATVTQRPAARYAPTSRIRSERHEKNDDQEDDDERGRRDGEPLVTTDPGVDLTGA